MDRDISLDAIKLVACIFVCTLHTIGMFMSESSDFHLSYLLFYMSGIAVPLFFMVNGFLYVSYTHLKLPTICSV